MPLYETRSRNGRQLVYSVQQSHNISLQIEIALDAGQVKEA
jgi:hypothetical protein